MNAYWTHRLGIGAVVTYLVATSIPAGESSAQRGTHALLTILWLGWGAIWFGLVARRKSGEVASFEELSCVGALAVCAATSTWFRGATADARGTLNLFWQFVAWLFAYLIVRDSCRSLANRRLLIATVIGIAAGQAAIGAYQATIVNPAALRDYRARAAEILQGQSISSSAGDIHRIAFESRLGANLPTGTFLHSNSLAGLLAIGAALITPAILARRFAVGPFVLSVFALVVVVLFVTKSRAGIASAGVGLVAAWILLNRGQVRDRPRASLRFKAGLLAVLGMFAVAAIDLARGAPWLRNAAQSLVVRGEYWMATTRLILDMPLLGCGMGNFQDYYYSYRPPEASEVVADPHNLWFEIAATIGLPSLACLATLFATTARDAVQAWKLAETVREDAGERSEAQATITKTTWLVAACVGLVVGITSAAVKLRMPPIPMVMIGGIVGIVSAVAALRSLHRSPRFVTTIAILVAPCVLVLHLHVSGGIYYAGLAVPLWCLLALTRVERFRVSNNVVSGPIGTRSQSNSGRWQGPARVVLASVAGLAFIMSHWTSFRPAYLSDPLLAQANLAAEGGAYDLALEKIRAAAATDPISGAIARRRMEIAWDAFQTKSGTDELSERMNAESDAKRLNPRSPALHGWLGNKYFAEFRRSGDEADLQRAIVEYRSVVKLYPNAAAAWAQLAYACQLTQTEQGEAVDAAERARWLDDRQSHAEQKLNAQRLFDVPIPVSTADKLIDSIRPTRE